MFTRYNINLVCKIILELLWNMIELYCDIYKIYPFYISQMFIHKTLLLLIQLLTLNLEVIL